MTSLSYRIVSIYDGTWTTAKSKAILHQRHSKTSDIGPLAIGFAAFLGFLSFWLATSQPASVTIPHLSVLAAFCLLLAGLCRWTGGSRSKAPASEERFRSLFEGTAGAMSIVDGDKRFIQVNRAYCELLGYDAGEILGRPFTMMMHPDETSEHLAQWDELWCRTEGAHAQEKRYLCKDGSTVWVRVTACRFNPSDGTAPLVLQVVEQLSNRTQVEPPLLEAHTVLESALDGISKLDDAGRYLFANGQYAALLGYRPEELIGQSWEITVHPEDRTSVFDTFAQMLAVGRAEAEIRGVKKDGSLIYKHVVIVKPDGPAGRMPGHFCFARDITRRKRAEEHLQRTRFAMDQAVDAVYWIDPQARILYANEAACAMLGYTGDEFLRMTVHDLNPDFPPEVWPGWWEETRAQKVMSLETVHLTKDGRRIPIDIRVSFLAYGGEEFHCAFVRDITERKRVDEALRASQERFELAARATNDGIWDWNILTGEQYWSARHLELFGLQAGALTPTYETWISLVHPDDADRVHQATCRHLEACEPYDIEVRVRMKDGRYRWFRDRGQALWDSTGRPLRMVGSISDVTEQRNAEAALRKAHVELEQRVYERTRQLAMANQSLQEEIAERKRVADRLRMTQYAVDHAADQIFVLGPNGSFLDVNESACRALGYSKEELLTMRVMDIDPDFSPEVWGVFWERFTREGKVRLETRHRSKSGEIYPVEVVANYLHHDGQEFDYAIVRDITERKQAEAAVRDSELRYKLLTEATFDGIAVHDEGILLEVNAGLEWMFGYDAGELAGGSLWDLIADESRELVMANMRNGVNGPYEAMGRRKDGSTFHGELVVRPYRFGGKDVRLVAGRDITARKHLEVERSRHTEELEHQIVARTAEIAKLQSRRAQTERLAALGRLAAGVAHEINNPMAGIKAAFTLVKQAVDPAHAQYEFVGLVDREIDRVSSIVRNMYQLYRRESGKVETVDLRAMLGDIEALYAKQLQQRQLRLVVEAEPGVDRLDVPKSDLLQVLLNLLNNAIDCSREGTMITLSIREEADVVRIALADQGPGMSPEVIPQIFDPFFTTKTEGGQKGLGLGLSISQSLVTAMGGTIDVNTQIGQGSTFSILLPGHKVLPVSRDPTHTIKEVITHG